MNTETGEVLTWQAAINLHYPIVGFTLYHGSLKVRRKSNGIKNPKLPEQSHVTRLSKKSLNRLAFMVSSTSVEFVSILTLTFLDIKTDGKKVKAMLNRFLTSLRRKVEKPEYIWFLEFQERGAPHFHVLLNFLPSPTLRLWCASRWAEIVGDATGKVEAVHRHVKQWEKIRSIDGAKRYVLKYALKPHQKVVPEDYKDVGRFWGNSRGVKPQPIADVECTEAELRERIEAVRPGFNEKMPHLVPKYVFLS